MKTITLLLAAFCSTITTFGQTTPDMSFEKWETATLMGKTYTTVWGWTTNNLTNVLAGDEESAEATSNAFQGDYALRLINKPNGNHMSAAAITQCPTPDNEYNEKFPITSRVTALTGYFQYQPADNDTFNVYILIYKDGMNIGYGEFGTGGTHNAYESFTATIEYFEEGTPDSASITIFTSRDEFKEGSILTIDQLSLESGLTGIGEKSKATFKCEVSPNPSQGKFILSYEQLKKGNTTISIYDLLGNEVKQFKNNWEAGKQELSIDCTDLRQGLYLLKLEQSGVEKTMRISIQ